MGQESIEKDDQFESGDDSGDSAWMTSYADMMTLIACFFILMMAFANYDPAGFTKKTKEVAKHFNGQVKSEEKSKMQELVDNIQGHPDLSDETKVAIDDSGVEIVFNSTQVFEPGRTSIRTEQLMLLNYLIEIIKEKEIDFRILVEGHTDNLKIGKNSRFTNNWELSSARAASVIQRFQDAGFAPQKLVAIGYGDTRPMVPNQDDEGRNIVENLGLNRRVVIKVLRPLNTKRFKKLGLGVYFSESDIIVE